MIEKIVKLRPGHAAKLFLVFAVTTQRVAAVRPGLGRAFQVTKTRRSSRRPADNESPVSLDELSILSDFAQWPGGEFSHAAQVKTGTFEFRSPEWDPISQGPGDVRLKRGHS